MNDLWYRFLRATYRKEPISSFFITVGTVDAVIGGIDNRLPLLTLGLGTIGAAIAIRWWKMQGKKPSPFQEGAPIHYLPSRSSRPQLPTLGSSRKNSPNLD
ncbi:MAG: hypothetical protein ACFE0J_15950 [Elainellaceae cyanobacterium]